MKRFIWFFLTTACIFVCSNQIVKAQIYQHNFGTNSISAHPYTSAPSLLDANLSGSSWTNSKGAWTSYTGSAGQAIALSNSSGTPTITLTIQVATGYEMSVSSFSFWRQRSSSGAQAWSMTIGGIPVGSGTVPTSGANTGSLTPTNSIYGLTGTVAIVISLSGASGTGTFRLDDFTLNGSVTTTSSNTITTGAVSGGPFSVTCTATDAGTVAFISSGTFLSGNVYTAQLSDAAGSFAFPVSIGTLTSSANSGSIIITIPAGTITGSGYKIRVVGSNPSVTGTVSAAISITLSGGPCSCIEIESILVDACNGSDEGENEMFRFLVGVADINVSDISVDWPSNSWLSLCQDATTANIVSEINATITGGGQLIEPVGGVIPAGSQVMFFTSTDFSYSLFDFSMLNYDLYVIFQCAGNTAGHFANYTGSGNRTLSMSVSSCGSDEAIYNCGLLYHGDGATVDYDVAGNPIYSTTGQCSTVPIFPTPIELLGFKASCEVDYIGLHWSTATETNNDYFTIEAAENGNGDFVPLAKVDGAGNSNEVLNYSVKVESSARYYRLKQTDYDGKFTYSEVIAVDCEDISVQLFPSLAAEGENITIIGEVSSIRVFDSMGREVFPEINENKVCCLEPGMYFFVINGKWNHKVVVQ